MHMTTGRRFLAAAAAAMSATACGATNPTPGPGSTTTPSTSTSRAALTASNRPSARINASLAFDPVRHRLVLFGGRAPAQPTHLNETWVWDGATWSRVTTAVAPEPRESAPMAFDPSSGHLVLFGGLGTSLAPTTWVFDGTAWAALPTTHAPATGPAGAFRGEMAADPATSNLILEGWDGGQAGNTYQFAHGDWTIPQPPVCPAATGCRAQAALAVDPATSTLLLAAGGTQGLTNETDTWNGTAWTLVHTPTMPPGAPFTGATDATAGAIVATSCQGDTWLYRAGTWAAAHPAHALPAMSKFGMCSLADDPDHHVVIATGVADTDPTRLAMWAWDGTDWSALTPG